MRKKRVGTFTLAVSLIYLGVVLILSLFVNLSTLITLLRFSPAVLIVMGIEVLICSLRCGEDEKLKYDGVSIFLILLFLFGALCIAALGWSLDYYSNVADTPQYREFIEGMFKLHPNFHLLPSIIN